MSDYNFTVGVSAEFINEDEFRKSVRKIIQEEIAIALREELKNIKPINVEFTTIKSNDPVDFYEQLRRLSTVISDAGLR